MDSTVNPSVARHCRDQVGEGVAWNERTGSLSWVDIANGVLHEWQPGTDWERTTRFDGELGAAVPRRGGGYLLALSHELLLLDPDGEAERVATIEERLGDNRLNDCRCDPAGRLWAGTMSKPRHPGMGALYRFDSDRRLTTMLGDTTLSNGLGWSPDAETMYFIDSVTQRVDAYEFDLAGGSLGRRRAFAEIDPADGLPDGLCVDSDGGVWVALFGGGAVRRYSAAGELDVVVEFPVTNTTCPAFGGPGLETLYVTSTRHLLSCEELAAQPLAGSLFQLRPGVSGLAATPFAG